MPSTMNDSPWMTKPEATEYLKVSTETLRRYTTNGWLTAYKIGGTGSVRYKREDLDDLMVQIDVGPEWLSTPPDEAVNKGDCPCPSNTKHRATYPNSTGCDHVWCTHCLEWQRDNGLGGNCGYLHDGPYADESAPLAHSA